MKVRLETCRPLVYRHRRAEGSQAGRHARGGDGQAARLASRSCKSSLDAVQIFGGYGYMTEQQVERDLRDAVGSTLYSGHHRDPAQHHRQGAGAVTAVRRGVMR